MNSYAKSGVLRTLLTTIAVLLSIAVGVFIFGRYREMVSLDAPIGYMADAAAMYGMRGIGDAGLPYADRISAPFNHPLNRIPDDLHCYAFSMECSILRTTGLFQHDPITIVNIYYLLVYFICGLTALYALRRFGVGWLASGAGAVLFALLPYHFMRNVNHLTIANYSLIPLFMLVCAWIHDHHPGAAGANVLPERLPWREAAFVLLICLAWGLTNDYYAFMFLLFAWLAAFLSSTRNRSLHPIYAAAGVTVGLMIAFGLRRALVHMSWGANAGVSFGTFQLTGYGEDEQYPLKLIQMILPGPHQPRCMHWSPEQIYSNSHPLVNENSYAVLGVVLAIAMLVLLARSLFGRPDQGIRDRFLEKNLLFAILVGAMGGIGTIISEVSWSIFGSRFPLSQARGWNRVYVFLAFVVVVSWQHMLTTGCAGWASADASSAGSGFRTGLVWQWSWS